MPSNFSLGAASAPQVDSTLVTSALFSGVAQSSTAIDGKSLTTAEQKLLHSCQEFESMMLAKLWEGMDKTFGDDPSAEDKDPGADTIRSLGIQTTSMALATQGGIGLAQIMFKQLDPIIGIAPGAGAKSLK